MNFLWRKRSLPSVVKTEVGTGQPEEVENMLHTQKEGGADDCCSCNGKQGLYATPPAGIAVRGSNAVRIVLPFLGNYR